MTDANQPPKKRGCLFYGCLTLLLVGLLGVALTYIGYRYVANKVTVLVNEYTDTTPAVLEKVEISQGELTALRQRVAEFGEALEKKQGVRELVLTAADINALLAHEPTFKDFKDRFLVSIEGDSIRGKLSMPLENIGPLKLKGRYLNGEAALKVSLANGVLLVTLDDVQVKGKPLPGPILTELKNQNLAQEILKQPENAKKIQKFESIQIKDGTVILRNNVEP